MNVFDPQILLLISSILLAFVIGITLRRREAPGAPALLLFLAGTLIWALTYSMLWTTHDLEARQFWLNMTYFGVVITPTAMFLFITQFTNKTQWFRGGRIWLYLIMPILTIFILWTDPLHGWFYGPEHVPGQTWIFSGGPWFWINVVYIYSLVVIALFLLYPSLVQSSRLQQRQSRLVFAAVFFPILGNLISFAGLNPFPGFDLTPLAFTSTGLILAYAFYRHGLLDLIPIGRDVLMDQMDEGMLLLDDQLRVVDVNPAALKMLNLTEKDLVGQPLAKKLADWPEWAGLLENGKEAYHEMETIGEDCRYLRVHTMEVREEHSDRLGMLVILHDITDQKMYERKLIEVNRHLKHQVEQIEKLQANLREQVLRDPLTGLFNRRYLEETLERELSKAVRSGRPLSLVMIDIDHFKQLNDVYGHQAGDLVLRMLSQLLGASSRASDIVARIGGDEFVVVLIDIPCDAAFIRVRGWAESFGGSKILYEGQELWVTFSAGVAAFSGEGMSAEALIRQADAALYRAKSAGRNTVLMAEGDSKLPSSG